MYVSQACEKLNLDFIREGEYDAVALLGLPRNETERHIAYVLHPDYIHGAIQEGCECLIVKKDMMNQAAEMFDGGLCAADDPKEAMFDIHALLNEHSEEKPSVIDPTVEIASTAIVSKTNVRIGKGTIIEDNVVIKKNVSIGDFCHVMAGTIIGTPAYYYYGSGERKKIVCSTGSVCIKDHVTIHANAVICKGVIGGATLLEDNVSIDSHVQIAHDCKIGKNSFLAAGCTLAGWVQVGENCFFGMNTAAAPIIKVTDNVQVSIGAILTRDVKEAGRVSGNFAIEHRQFISNLKNIIGE